MRRGTTAADCKRQGRAFVPSACTPGPPFKFAGVSVEVPTSFSGGKVDGWTVPSAGYALVPLNRQI